MMSSRVDAKGPSATEGWRARIHPGAQRRFVIPLVFLLACLPFLATTLDDVDAFNFALAVRDYDPTLHQPHPPGYPVYVALAKGSTAVVELLLPEGDGAVAGQSNAALGLALWSAAGGALALLFLPLLFSKLSAATRLQAPELALAATLLTAGCPLFWFTSLRPLSDVPGLAAALGAQALILLTLAAAPGKAFAMRLGAACFVSALIVGVRSQTMWLTLPLLAFVLAVRWRSLSLRALALGAGATALGVLAWAVPMVLATGGLEAYLTALAGQGAEDFTGVDMLYRNPTSVRLAEAMFRTFVWPWASAPLAAVVLCLAALGALRLLVKAPWALLLGLVAFAPYAVFHLLFHETITTRYALPLVPPIAWMAAAGASLARRRFGLALVGVVAAWGAVTAWPAVTGYHGHGSPVARAIADMSREASANRTRPAVGMHYEMRRAVQWSLRDPGLWPTVITSSPGDEVAATARYFEAGGARTVWFLANPRRIDLGSFDPASLRELARYAWPFDSALAGNPRPNEVAWYELSRPGWYVLDGWALNPEMAGRSAKLRLGPSSAPIEARIRRRESAAVGLLGGRHVGPVETGAARVVAKLDGRSLAGIEVSPHTRFFLQRIDLPAGVLRGDGAFARLEVSAAGGGPVAIEQFDIQDADRTAFGFADGWHEPEYAPARGLQWRWASERAELLVHNGGRDVEVEIRGESPLRYFHAPTRIVISAATKHLQQIEPRDDFVIRAVVPRELLDLSGGLVTLESNQHFTPAARGESADPRHLALRVYSVAVRPR